MQIQYLNELMEDTEYVFKIDGEMTLFTVSSFFYKGPVHDGPDGIFVHESETPLLFSEIQEIHTEEPCDEASYFEDYMMDMLEL